MTELDRLLELALRATPGPWRTFRNRHTTTDGHDWGWVAPSHNSRSTINGMSIVWERPEGEDNARFLAAASPDRVKALVMRLKRAEEALRPFAKFDMSGFDGIVLEVVPSDPRNPAPRVEPILADYFRRAAAYFKPAGEGE